MIANLLLILGVLILSIGLRSFDSVYILRRLGSLGILATSFLVGWLLVHSLALGIFLVLAWFLFPWIEILTRIRRLRMPIEQSLKPQSPPRGPYSSSIEEISGEIEKHAYAHVTDTGWNWQDHHQFYRVFYKSPSRTCASICINQQSHVTFYYVSLRSRDVNGRVFITWNCPFFFGLKLSPNCRLSMVPDADLEELESSHKEFLQKNGVTEDLLLEQDPHAIPADMQEDARTQVLHNIHIGLLKREGKDFFRYSARGLIYLWFQSIKEMIRIF